MSLTSSQPLSDYTLCELCRQQRQNTNAPDQPACHDLLCKAFFDKSSDAMECVLQIFGGIFNSWVVGTAVYPKLLNHQTHLQISDILQDVFVGIFRSLRNADDCYDHFPTLPRFFGFIKISIRNRELELAGRYRPPVYVPTISYSKMEQIERLVRETLNDEEYLVWEFWIYGEPELEAVRTAVGGDNAINTIKKRLRKKLLKVMMLRELLEVSPEEF